MPISMPRDETPVAMAPLCEINATRPRRAGASNAGENPMAIPAATLNSPLTFGPAMRSRWPA